MQLAPVIIGIPFQSKKPVLKTLQNEIKTAQNSDFFQQMRYKDLIYITSLKIGLKLLNKHIRA